MNKLYHSSRLSLILDVNSNDMVTLRGKLMIGLGEYFPALCKTLEAGSDVDAAIATIASALEDRSLSWARANQCLHMSSQAGMTTENAPACSKSRQDLHSRGMRIVVYDERMLVAW